MSLKTNVSQALEWAQISHDDYNTVIQALFVAAPARANVEIDRVIDSRGGPVANASISRKFDEFVLSAEDRGPTYAVWIIEAAKGALTRTILFFAEFPWGQLNTVK